MALNISEFKSIFDNDHLAKEPAHANEESQQVNEEQQKVYMILFKNGQTCTVKAEKDYAETCFDSETPVLRLFNGDIKDKKIVAIFNLNNIAGYATLNTGQYITDDYCID